MKQNKNLTLFDRCMERMKVSRRKKKGTKVEIGIPVKSAIWISHNINMISCYVNSFDLIFSFFSRLPCFKNKTYTINFLSEHNLFWWFSLHSYVVDAASVPYHRFGVVLSFDGKLVSEIANILLFFFLYFIM